MKQMSMNELYKLKSLVRYNQRLRITNETVAEHSYYVTLFTMLICDECKLDDLQKLDAMMFAMIHDIPEIYTSDIPYPVKQANPELKKLLDGLEKRAVASALPNYYQALFTFVEDTKGEGATLIKEIVKLADALSVWQYINAEKRLGNSEFERSVEDTKNRIDRHKYNIEQATGIYVNCLID